MILTFTDEERRLSARVPVPEDQFHLLAFSAKESISKCLHPLLKRFPDYSTVILDDINFRNRTFHFHLSDAIEPGFLGASDGQGRFAFMHGGVHTGVELLDGRRPGNV